MENNKILDIFKPSVSRFSNPRGSLHKTISKASNQVVNVIVNQIEDGADPDVVMDNIYVRNLVSACRDAVSSIVDISVCMAKLSLSCPASSDWRLPVSVDPDRRSATSLRGIDWQLPVDIDLDRIDCDENCAVTFNSADNDLIDTILAPVVDAMRNIVIAEVSKVVLILREKDPRFANDFYSILDNCRIGVASVFHDFALFPVLNFKKEVTDEDLKALKESSYDVFLKNQKEENFPKAMLRMFKSLGIASFQCNLGVNSFWTKDFLNQAESLRLLFCEIYEDEENSVSDDDIFNALRNLIVLLDVYKSGKVEVGYNAVQLDEEDDFADGEDEAVLPKVKESTPVAFEEHEGTTESTEATEVVDGDNVLSFSCFLKKSCTDE